MSRFERISTTVSVALVSVQHWRNELRRIPSLHDDVSGGVTVGYSAKVRSRSSVLRRFLTLLALVASIAAASTTVVHAAPVSTASGDGVGIRLLDPSGGSFPEQNYIIDHRQPGGTIQRRVQVTNSTAQNRTVDVYAGAASLRNGEFTVQDRGTANRLTTWASVNRQSLPLAGGTSADVTVTITVPADAPAGTQYGVVWAQPVTDGSALATAPRVGVRAYVTVEPPTGRTADYTIVGLAAERDSRGQAVVVADVRNTGTWAVALEGEVTLSRGPGGATVEPVPSDDATIAAGATGKVRFRIPDSADLPNGPWQAGVTLRSAAIEREYAGEITFPTAGTGGGSLGSLGFGSLGSGSL
ncbi:hypothetical protein [Rhodococcus sp. ACT016]|uniref:hypothetical protein n=1 Tax=Rhodococcus sp. ACT016 TaxID=3134808 RepID=UPI003D295B88